MARGFLVFILLLSSLPFGRPENKTPPECQQEAGKCYNKPAALRLKIIAIVSILFTSTVGVCLPLFSRSVPALMPDRNLFVIVKAFASGIILATGYMHVLPDSFACLTSVCLPDNPWHKFPFSTFVAMLSAVFTLLVESVSTSYYRKINAGVVKPAGRAGDVEMSGGEQAAVSKGGFDSVLLKHRVVSQVLELGIVVHSVVIGLSLGATQNPCTIRPLIAALCFHQLFEGMGLGGCILQAEYTNKVKAIMVFFFSTTTPFGIVLGIGLSNVYSDNSPTALIVVGVLNASSAGLLNYMALVDLLAADFMGLKLQSNIKLQIQAFFAVLLGVGGMSLMAKWA